MADAVEISPPKKKSRLCVSSYLEVVSYFNFVDKSMFLKALLDFFSGKNLLTAPRRFGKSTMMSMTKDFYEIPIDENGIRIDKEKSPTYKLFKDHGLKIFTDAKGFFDENFGTYPVIHLNFSKMKGTLSKVIEQFKLIVERAFTRHKYLEECGKLDRKSTELFQQYLSLSSTEQNDSFATNGLLFLSECLHKYYEKPVFVLIDEYDTPTNYALTRTNISVDDINLLMSDIFNFLKDEECVGKALLTGVSYFASVGLIDVNNVEKCQFLSDHPFVEYVGLTSQEVESLLEKNQSTKEEKNQVKEYYNGYCNKTMEVNLYSLWSVLNYFEKKKKIGSYWEDSGICLGFVAALRIPVIRDIIEKLCLGQSQEIVLLRKVELQSFLLLQKMCSDQERFTLNKPDLYLNFMLQQGYLSFDNVVSEERNVYKMKLPNEEIKIELKQKLLDFYGPIPETDGFKEAVYAFKKLSADSPEEDFQDFIDKFKVFWDNADRKILNTNEDVFHCFLFNLIYKADFLIGSEYPIRGKRIDLLLIFNDLGIIIELKSRKDGDEALKQILKKYVKVFANEERFMSIKNQMYMGINLDDENEFELTLLRNGLSDIKKRETFRSKKK